MAKRTTTLAWHVVLDGTAWDQPESLAALVEALGDDGAAAQHPRWRRPLLVAAIGLVLLSLSIAGFVLWRQAQTGYQQIEADIKRTVDLESWSTQTGNYAVGSALVDGNASGDWRNQLVQEEYTPLGASSRRNVTIRDVELQDDLAWVTLGMAQPDVDPPAAYRTTRVYRSVDGTWLRTAPAPQFWGPAESLETAHFVFHFRHKDREAVEAAAARMGAIASDLRRDLALNDAPAGKTRIDVVMHIPAGTSLRVDQDRMTVLSPLLQTIPENVSNADILTKSIVHPLVRHAMDEAQVREVVLAEWSLLLHGVQLWQAYAGSDSLPLWQTDLITWLHRDAPALRRGEREPSAADRALLCRVYFVWGHTLPLNPSPSTLCIDPAWRRHLPYKRPPPQRLQELVLGFESDRVRNGWTGNWMERVAAATVIEFLVETYGRDRMPVLITGMGRYRTWDELTPAVVGGVTAEEFEAGWQTYVAARDGG